MSINIFVSRPNSLNVNQEKTMHRLEKILEDRGMRARTIGETDFTNDSPMRAVEQLMRLCSGAVILGFPQTIIQKGISKPGTDNEQPIINKLLPTPWNHIESSMAFMLDLPSLVIRNQGIEGGIFDNGTTGQYIHTFQLDNEEWMDKQVFLQPFNNWHQEVVRNQKVTH